MTSLRTPEGRIEYLKKRNTLINKLRLSTRYLNEARIAECTKSVIEGYTNASNIAHMARVMRESTLEEFRFRTISLHVLINKDKFLAKDYYWGHYFADVGRAIARGEEKYIHRRISLFSTSFEDKMSNENPNFSTINKGIRRLQGNGVTPNVILMPIELHTDFIKHFDKKLVWSIDGPPQLVDEGCNLQVFWSNKYAPLKSIMIFDSNAGIWHVFEDTATEKNITFAIGESEQNTHKIAYFVETLAYYHIENKKAFVKIKLSQKQKRNSIKSQG